MIRFSDHQAAVKALAWSPHQHGVIASGGGTADQCIRFWNTATASPLNCINTGTALISYPWLLPSGSLCMQYIWLSAPPSFNFICHGFLTRLMKRMIGFNVLKSLLIALSLLAALSFAESMLEMAPDLQAMHR